MFFEKTQIGKNSFNYVIYHKLIVRVLLIYKSSSAFSMYAVSNVLISVNLQVW